MSKNPNNICSFIGRLTRDPELYRTSSNNAVCSFSLAVDRNYTDTNGNWPVDFIDCVAWRKRAENICANWKKGDLVTVSGALQIRPWVDKNGNKRTTAEIVVDARRKLSSAGMAMDIPSPSSFDYPPMPTDDDFPSPGEFLELDDADEELPL